MKARIALIAVAAASITWGCGNKSMKPTSSLDLSPQTYTPPQPVVQPTPVAQPVVYDTPAPAYAAPTPVPAANTPTVTGGTYTVKKGDTLFAIAKSRYGNGNQWQKIAAANPGLTPQNLKAGQTITIPN